MQCWENDNPLKTFQSYLITTSACLFDEDFALWIHSPCWAEDKWSKGAIFHFHYTVVVKMLFLWFIWAVSLGESETTVPPSEWIENPYVEKCSLPLCQNPRAAISSHALSPDFAWLPRGSPDKFFRRSDHMIEILNYIICHGIIGYNIIVTEN